MRANNSPSRQRFLLLLGLGLVSLSLLSGYTFKNGKKKQADTDFHPPPYMSLVRQALVRKEQVVAARFLKAARKCWKKRGRACGFQKHTYLIYLGVLTLQRGKAQRAVTLLEQARGLWKKKAPKLTKKPANTAQDAQKRHLRLGQTLSFYLGQAYFRTGNYKSAVPALRNAEALVGKMSGYFRLLALAELKAGFFDASRRTLLKGLSAFPREQSLLQLAVMLYLKVGAIKAALSIGRRLLRAVPRSNPTPFLVAVDKMRQAGLVYQVLPLLEEARLYIPGNRDILLRLGIAYSQAQMPSAAARYFSALAQLQPAMAYYAAAAWMRAGNLHKALLWNQRVANATKRAQQRSRILLNQGKYARTLVLLRLQWKKKSLRPHGRYRLAYVALRLGNYALAQKVLASLKGTSHAANAQRLQQTLRLCRKTPWRCLE